MQDKNASAETLAEMGLGLLHGGVQDTIVHTVLCIKICQKKLDMHHNTSYTQV